MVGERLKLVFLTLAFMIFETSAIAKPNKTGIMEKEKRDKATFAGGCF
ncbi:MAG: hypothetical protein GY866_12840 [Proteobacteria bacterium]|nr:hypothetical protein [Pseudomonadota bacterium]